MNQRQIGVIVIIIGILFSLFLFIAKAREDQYMREIMDLNQGSCFLEDGTCLHADRSFLLYVFGGVMSLSSVVLGIYLVFFDKTQQMLASQHKEVSLALKEAREKEKEKDEFNAFISGFNEDEQKVLKAIKEQEGIQQSTLRYRTGMSKTALSLLLKSLEDRDIITRKHSGKTNMIFLRKKF